MIWVAGCSAPCASETSLADAHRESKAQSFWSIQRGRPFGEQGSILCGHSRVQGRDPPVFSAGSTGKSQTTHSVSGTGGADARDLPSPRPKCCQESKCRSGTGFRPPPRFSPGQGFRRGLGYQPKRTARFRGLGFRLRAKRQSLRVAAIPSWALRGEKPRSFGAGPGEQGSRPQVSRQWKRWKSQTTRIVSGPGRPAARVLELSCPHR